jgi:hypothetical protein
MNSVLDSPNPRRLMSLASRINAIHRALTAEELAELLQMSRITILRRLTRERKLVGLESSRSCGHAVPVYAGVAPQSVDCGTASFQVLRVLKQCVFSAGGNG